MHELWSISYLGGSETAPAAVVDVQPGTYSFTVTEPDFAIVTLIFGQTGIVSVFGGTGPTYQWLTPGVGAATEYEIYFQLNSGTLSSGTTGSWINLGSAASWSLSRNTVGTSTVTGTISIRRTSDSLVLDSADVTLTVTVNAGSSSGGGGGDYGGENDPGAGGNGEHLP